MTFLLTVTVPVSKTLPYSRCCIFFCSFVFAASLASCSCLCTTDSHVYTYTHAACLHIHETPAEGHTQIQSIQGLQHLYRCMTTFIEIANGTFFCGHVFAKCLITIRRRLIVQHYLVGTGPESQWLERRYCVCIALPKLV